MCQGHLDAEEGWRRHRPPLLTRRVSLSGTTHRICVFNHLPRTALQPLNLRCPGPCGFLGVVWAGETVALREPESLYIEAREKASMFFELLLCAKPCDKMPSFISIFNPQNNSWEAALILTPILQLVKLRLREREASYSVSTDRRGGRVGCTASCLTVHCPQIHAV